MAASDPGGAVLAVAISGRRSRRAIRWAAENLIPHASRVLLLHVIPPLSPTLTSPTLSPPAPLFSSLSSYLSLNSSNNSGNSSARDSGAEDDVSGELVEVPRRVAVDRMEQKREALEPYRKLCKTDKEVRIEVLEAEDVAGAILEYVAGSEVKNLVLGCASYIWLNRIIKGHDVPANILNSAPGKCNIFLVSGRKLILKLASDSITSGFSPTLHIQKTKSSLLTQGERGLLTQGERGSRTSRSRSLPTELSDKYQPPSDQRRIDSLDGNDNAIFNASYRNSELALAMPSIWEEQHDHNWASLNNNRPEIQRSQTHPLVFSGNSSAAGHSGTESDAEEVERLREKLRSTLSIYDHACKELAFGRRKVELVSAECSEGEMKLRQAQAKEEAARKFAEEEKARHIEAAKEVEEAKLLLVKEALEKHIAEINAIKESTDKLKVMDALFSDENICRSYTSYEIEAATNNFSEVMKIGEGGYGYVYKCCLDQIPVAIKVLRKDRIEKKEQFFREVEILTQLRHPHVVLLLGVCAESGCLIYEYMENGSLDDRLFCKGGTKPLPWATRFRVLFEVARTLAFLHGSKPDPVVHCDLKPGNILLDQNYVSKIGDVGLARLMSDVVPDDITEYRDTLITGTPHYMDPEYHRTGTMRPKSDLYAFGIIALQVLTARRPLGLLADVENTLKDGTFATILDKSVIGWPLEESEKLARIALKCAALRCRDRPDLGSEVIPELEQIMSSLDTRLQQKELDTCMPSQYYCPILQEVMTDPYIAADGFTYERHAIEAWLAKHNVSPMTRLRLPNNCILPNLTMRSAIQEWRPKMELPAS